MLKDVTRAAVAICSLGAICFIFTAAIIVSAPAKGTYDGTWQNFREAIYGDLTEIAGREYKLGARITELERQVHGVQGQINFFHALADQEKKRADGAAARDQLQEKKITEIINILKLQHSK